MVSSLRVRVPPSLPAGFLTFVAQGNEPVDDDHGRLLTYPSVGSGEFTISRWLRLDSSYPYGTVSGVGSDPNNNWASEDPQPPALPDNGSSLWWVDCNFIEDGYSNDTFAGSSLGLSMYGSGRVRWTIADGTNFMAVQAYPATNTSSIRDDLWHLVTQRRRFPNGTDSVYELLIDGVVIASITRPNQLNFDTIWSGGAGQQTGNEGLYFGAEKQAAINTANHFPDMKGDYKELSWWDAALSNAVLVTQFNNGPGALTGNETNLVSRYTFTQGSGTTVPDAQGAGATISIVNILQSQWTP